MRRASFLLAAMILVGCHGTTYYQQRVENPCSATPPGKGFVCVGANLTPAPDPVHQSRGNWVHAFMANGNEIVIASEIFENAGHRGSHAWGRIKSEAVVGKRYKYTILNVTTGRANDPDVMIDPVQ